MVKATLLGLFGMSVVERSTADMLRQGKPALGEVEARGPAVEESRRLLGLGLGYAGELEALGQKAGEGLCRMRS